MNQFERLKYTLDDMLRTNAAIQLNDELSLDDFDLLIDNILALIRSEQLALLDRLEAQAVIAFWNSDITVSTINSHAVPLSAIAAERTRIEGGEK